MKTAICLKGVYRFSAILIKILISFLAELEKRKHLFKNVKEQQLQRQSLPENKQTNKTLPMGSQYLLSNYTTWP